MIVKYASNQIMIASNLTAMEITTDPINIPGYNAALGILTVHHIHAPGSNTAQLDVIPERSNDGSNWVTDPASFQVSTTGESANSEPSDSAQVRVKFKFDPANMGTDTGTAFIAFDFSVRYYAT